MMANNYLLKKERVKKLIERLRPVVAWRKNRGINSQFDILCFVILEGAEWLLDEVEDVL